MLASFFFSFFFFLASPSVCTAHLTPPFHVMVNVFAQLGFEEDTAKYGKQLSLTMAKFNALTEAERKDAKALRKDAQSNRERVEKLTSVANELGTIAQRLEKDLDAAQDKYKELLKAHKQSVATAQADRERVAEDHALALMARDKLLGAAEEKLRSQEHLGRALIGDSDLAEKLDTLERNAATSHLQILDLNRLIGEKDAQIKKQQEIIKKLQDDLEKALTSPSEVPKLKTRIFELQGEVKELKDTVTELGGSEDHLKLEIQELTQQVVQLKEGMRDLVGEKDKLAQEAHSAKLKLKELVDEVKKARAAEKEATKIAQEAEGRIQAAEDDAKKWQQGAEAAEQRARDADQALQVKIDAATASLRKELADARTEAATATARANEEAAKVPPLESEIEALKARPMGDPGLAAEVWPCTRADYCTFSRFCLSFMENKRKVFSICVSRQMYISHSLHLNHLLFSSLYGSRSLPISWQHRTVAGRPESFQRRVERVAPAAHCGPRARARRHATGPRCRWSERPGVRAGLGRREGKSRSDGERDQSFDQTQRNGAGED